MPAILYIDLDNGGPLIYSRPRAIPRMLRPGCDVVKCSANLARSSAVARLHRQLPLIRGIRSKNLKAKGELWLRVPGVGPVTAKILRGRNIAAPAAPACNPFVLTAAHRIHQKHVFATPAAVRLIAKSTAPVKARRKEQKASRSSLERFRNWHWARHVS